MGVLNSDKMPRLGGPRRRSRFPATLALALVVGAGAGAVFWFTREAPAAEVPPPSPEQVVAEALGDAGPLVTAEVTPERPEKALSLTVDGPLESAVVAAAGPEVGPSLTQVLARALVWWIRVPQELTRNDTISLVYEPRDGQEPVLHAVKFVSARKGQTFEAFRFQPPGAAFSRLYTPDGAELEERLTDSPLDAYEQITSLLRDGRGHKGVDFKTPVGTPVRATFDGVITRKNWNFRGNGNCLELTESQGGRTALYLHLSELPATVKVGQRVKKGEVIAKSGNSGHSFAPHLHYQLMRGDRVLDPFTQHPTSRVSLSPAELSSFAVARASFAALLEPTPVAAGER